MYTAHKEHTEFVFILVFHFIQLFRIICIHYRQAFIYNVVAGGVTEEQGLGDGSHPAGSRVRVPAGVWGRLQGSQVIKSSSQAKGCTHLWYLSCTYLCVADRSKWPQEEDYRHKKLYSASERDTGSGSHCDRTMDSGPPVQTNRHDEGFVGVGCTTSSPSQ